MARLPADPPPDPPPDFRGNTPSPALPPGVSDRPAPPGAADPVDATPTTPKGWVVRGMLLGGIVGGIIGAVNLGVGDPPGVQPDDVADGPPGHANAARYTGGCVLGGVLVGGLAGLGRVLRDKYAGPAARDL